MLTRVFVLGATGFVGMGVTVTAPPEIPAKIVDLVQPKLPARLGEDVFVEATRYRLDVTRSILAKLPRGARLFSARLETA